MIIIRERESFSISDVANWPSQARPEGGREGGTREKAGRGKSFPYFPVLNNVIVQNGCILWLSDKTFHVQNMYQFDEGP